MALLRNFINYVHGWTDGLCVCVPVTDKLYSDLIAIAPKLLDISIYFH